MAQAKGSCPDDDILPGERDFGDSAGEGTGGSGLDRRVVGDDVPLTEHEHNPLDDVMTPPGEPERKG
jgi:hypothetical protein